MCRRVETLNLTRAPAAVISGCRDRRVAASHGLVDRRLRVGLGKVAPTGIPGLVGVARGDLLADGVRVVPEPRRSGPAMMMRARSSRPVVGLGVVDLVQVESEGEAVMVGVISRVHPPVAPDSGHECLCGMCLVDAQ